MPSEPLILGFDTSAAHCAAALLSGDRILAERHEEMKKGQAERLMPMVQEILSEAGVTPGDLKAIGVGVGPGNFTGVRISVSAARGMALGLGVPAVGVTVFDALKYGHPDWCIATVAAPREQIYVSLPEQDPFGPVTLDQLKVHSISAVDPEERVDASHLDVVGALASEISAITLGDELLPKHSIPVAIARCAIPLLGIARPSPKPLYLRPADAAPSRDVPPELLD